jgi:hypothetical protein
MVQVPYQRLPKMIRECLRALVITEHHFMANHQEWTEWEFLLDLLLLATCHLRLTFIIATIITSQDNLHSSHNSNNISKPSISISLLLRSWIWPTTITLEVIQAVVKSLLLQAIITARSLLSRQMEVSQVVPWLWNKVWKTCKRC